MKSLLHSYSKTYYLNRNDKNSRCESKNSYTKDENEEEEIIQNLLSSFPEKSLLTIYANPLLIEYFSENINMLYALENMIPMLTKEWTQSEYM